MFENILFLYSRFYMKKLITNLMMAFILMCGLNAVAAPTSGSYTVQNVGTGKYVVVTGPYAAAPSTGTASEASKISFNVVGLDMVHNDGSYKISGLSSTYTASGKQVTVNIDNYIEKALTIGEVVIREELGTPDVDTSNDNINKAIAAMRKFVTDAAYMRIKPVSGTLGTYYAIATVPSTIDAEILKWFYVKVQDPVYHGHPELGADGMLEWGIKKVKEYLNTHGTDSGLRAHILANIDKLVLGRTYILRADGDLTFGYSSDEGGSLPTSAEYQWKLEKEIVPTSGTYKLRNVGKGEVDDDHAWVKVIGPYYAKPNYSETEATPIAVSISGQNADGSYKVIDLACEYNGKQISVQGYVDKAILMGKTVVATKLSGSSPENIAKAQQYMEEFVRANAFMNAKAVPSQVNTYLAFATIPVVDEAIQAAYEQKREPGDPERLFDWCKEYVINYLTNNNPGTNSTLVSYVLANIDNALEGHTYYLSADRNDGTFGYFDATAGQVDETDKYLWWGYDKETTPTSGIYKILNKETKLYIKVTDRYAAKPNEADEANASEIGFVQHGSDTNFNDGSYVISGLSSTYTDANGVEHAVNIDDYVQKAITIGEALIDKEIGPNSANPSSSENIAKAKKMMREIVEKWAYMRIMPVPGEDNTYYALATVPTEDVITDEILEAFTKKHPEITTRQGMLAWAKEQVLAHLNQGTDASVAAYVRAHIDKVEFGRTFMLAGNEDGTFDVVYFDGKTMPSDIAANDHNKWMLDQTQMIDELGEVTIMKVRNVGKGDVDENTAWVRITDRYYAKPNYSEAEATPIQVTIAQQNDDGTYKVTDLAGNDPNGNFISIKNYIDKAIRLGKEAIATVLEGQSSPDNILLAQNMMEEFVRASAFMTLKHVPGQEDTYFALGTIPVIPAEIVDAFHKKYPGVDMFEWCKGKVIEYLDSHGTNSILQSYVRANIEDAVEGHTYYLSANETNGTFDVLDATVLGYATVESNRYAWWGMAPTLLGDPTSGYFRIKNAESGLYVHVTGPLSARPIQTADAARTLPGTIIYVGMNEEPHGNGYLVNTLRSQGVNVNDYFDYITTTLQTVANVAVDMVQNSSIGQSHPTVSNMLPSLAQTLLETIDVNVYAEPIYSEAGDMTYMLTARTPDLAYYCELALDALSLVGKTQADLVAKLQQMEGQYDGIKAKLINAAWRAAQYLNDPQTMWTKLKENIKDGWFDTYLGGVPELADKIKNNFRDIEYATTYCLIAESDKSFGLQARDAAKDADASKWILEPVDADHPLVLSSVPHDDYNFIETTVEGEDNAQYNPVVELTEHENAVYGTLFVDFNAVLSPYAKAYMVYGTEMKSNDTGDYYFAKCKAIPTTEVDGQTCIAAQTPMILRSTAQEITLIPVGEPIAGTAVESDAYLKKLQDNISAILGQIGQMSSNAPQRVAQLDENNKDNLLMSSFFGDEVSEENDNQNLLPLNEGASASGNELGLGFWVVDKMTDKMEPNKAYLVADFANPQAGEGEGYVLLFDQEEDEDYPIVTNVTVVNTNVEVVGVTYYNIAGQESNVPFEGVNMVVTRYADGTKSVTKVIK